ncbi:MAG: acetyl-CoA decarbonylase/synthase complex subunit gamma [Candidatus Hydromicrobium americanum]|nr:MAG: acetyl-CoA decarbonylase/synthase complex subunit gamma [Candidatus Hydromicrobium americanum]
MALSGLEIFKKLPKTNCKDCGFPTCLAFAMQLAAGKVELEKCPHISEEVKEALSEASQPPILKVEIGAGNDSFVVGEETVMFRHDRTFVNQNAFAVTVEDDMDSSKIEEIIKDVNEIAYERVGQILKLDAICIKNKSKDKDKFLEVTDKVASLTKIPLILVSSDTEILKSAAGKFKENKPLIHAATADNIDFFIALGKETGCPIAVRGKSFEDIAVVTGKMREAGIKNLVIDIGSRDFKDDYYNQIILRMAAIKQKNRLFGYPTIVFPGEMTDDPLKETLIASVFVAKYGSIIVLSNASHQNIFPLMVYRQNIYTDPRRPMQVEQKIYEIGSPDENSPVLITTNFSLTYFIISGEVESSKVPSWLLVMDVEGQSVLTAWAAGKFVPELIAQFVKKSDIAEKVKKKEIVIPGYVAQLQGELEDELGDGWKVVVGPREAGEVPKFLKEYSA